MKRWLTCHFFFSIFLLHQDNRRVIIKAPLLGSERILLEAQPSYLKLVACLYVSKETTKMGMIRKDKQEVLSSILIYCHSKAQIIRFRDFKVLKMFRCTRFMSQEHYKTHKMTCAPERSVWSVSLLGIWRRFGSLATHKVHSEDWCPAWLESLLGAQIILTAMSCSGSHHTHRKDSVGYIFVV